MAPLARGCYSPLRCLVGSQELDLHPDGKVAQVPASQVGSVFDRFNFSLTYRPGSKNLKPDALSRVFSADNPTPECDPILPQSRIVATITWKIKSRVRLAQHDHPDPGTGPPNSLFVPDTVRSVVLQWAR